jgi:hypothetical protein
MFLIQLKESPVFLTPLSDLCDQEVQIGMPVEMVTRKILSDMDKWEIIRYGQSPKVGKFRPVMGYRLSPQAPSTI